MTTTHTPGPWTVDSDDGIDFTILGGKTSQVRIAVETSERDARLIAAAPEILEALRFVAESYQRHFDSMPVAWQTVDNIVCAAIDKATGWEACA